MRFSFVTLNDDTGWDKDDGDALFPSRHSFIALFDHPSNICSNSASFEYSQVGLGR
jgi:hypothetical protein